MFEAQLQIHTDMGGESRTRDRWTPEFQDRQSHTEPTVKKTKNYTQEARDGQGLRILVVLPEDQGSIPSAHIVAEVSQGIRCFLLVSMGTRHRCGTQKYRK